VHRKPISILLVLLAATALVAAGCGSKKSSGNAVATQSTQTTTTTPAATTTTTAAASTTTTTPTSTTAAAAIAAGIATSKNCRDLVNLSSKLSQAITGNASGNVKAYSAYLKALAEKAPPDIRPDFKVISDAYAKIADALGSTNLSSGQTPDAATIAKLMKLGQEIDQTALAKASTNIGAWLQKNCTHG
jgi:hypothetical protein